MSKKWSLNVQAIKYWMVFRGLGFLEVVWFLAQPLHTTTVPSANCLSFSVFLCSRSSLLTEERGSEWARSQIIRPRKSLALYKLLNTLGWRLWTFSLPCPHMHLGDKEFLVALGTYPCTPASNSQHFNSKNIIYICQNTVWWHFNCWSNF
jgi:hypothetical protein